MNKYVVALIAAIFTVTLFGCLPAFSQSPAPGKIKKVAPNKVPPGQVKRQTNPSGPKPIPPGQAKKAAPSSVVVIAPPLPPIVEIEAGLHFLHDGFYYFIEDGVWFYADRPDGLKLKLPKSHYPKEVKYKKGKGKGKAKGHDK
jgi:hypothetical protein